MCKKKVNLLIIFFFKSLKTSLITLLPRFFNETDKDHENFKEIEKKKKNNSKMVAIIIKSMDESIY